MNSVKGRNFFFKKSVGYILLTLLLNILFLYLYQYHFYDIGTYFLQIPIILIFIILVIIGFIRFIQRRKYCLLLVSILVIAANLLAPLLRIPINDFECRESEKRGMLIVSALDKYYKEHKEYPEKLDELKNRYLTSVPRQFKFTNENESFSYYKQDKNNYKLSYYAYCEIIYVKESNEWSSFPRSFP